MNKQEQIAFKLAKPIKVDDSVNVSFSYNKKTLTKKGKKMVEGFETVNKNGVGKVIQVINNEKHGLCYELEIENCSIPSELRLPYQDFPQLKTTDRLYRAEWVFQNIFYCGANPFKERLRIRFISSTIQGILFKGAYGRRSETFEKPEYKIIHTNYENDKHLNEKSHGGINFNPYVIDKDGNKQYYQRGLIWTLEQKQLLIQSIFNRIEIGKFVFKYNSWAQIQREIKETNHGFDWECVDGKQRFHAILEYLQGKFSTSDGIYWNDLSESAQLEFFNYDNLTIGELEENASSEDVLKTFLTINFTGVPMSKEHINFVQSIKLK